LETNCELIVSPPVEVRRHDCACLPSFYIQRELKEFIIGFRQCVVILAAFMTIENILGNIRTSRKVVIIIFVGCTLD